MVARHWCGCGRDKLSAVMLDLPIPMYKASGDAGMAFTVGFEETSL